MPGMNGAELAAAVREKLGNLPVLLVTGYASIADAAAAHLPQLIKPFRQAELAAQVARLLEDTKLVPLPTR